jgi:hypothetical protein
MVVILGFVLLGLCLGLGHMLGATSGVASAAVAFLPLWFAGAAVNMFIGVQSAGHFVSEETPIFFVVFAIPAVVALGVWWKLT